MWAYLTHYLWIIIFVKNVIIVYKFDLKAAAPLTFIGTEIQIFDRIDFDKSVNICINNKKQNISNELAKHLLIKNK